MLQIDIQDNSPEFKDLKLLDTKMHTKVYKVLSKVYKFCVIEAVDDLNILCQSERAYMFGTDFKMADNFNVVMIVQARKW